MSKWFALGWIAIVVGSGCESSPPNARDDSATGSRRAAVEAAMSRDPQDPPVVVRYVGRVEATGIERPEQWTEVGLPGSNEVVAMAEISGERQETPRVMLRATKRIPEIGIQVGDIVGVDAFDVGDYGEYFEVFVGEIGGFEPRVFVTSHDIPPNKIIGLVAGLNDDYPNADPSIWQDMSTAPAGWLMTTHVPVPGDCHLPPNPIFGLPTTSAPPYLGPSYWWYKTKMLGENDTIPMGAIIGADRYFSGSPVDGYLFRELPPTTKVKWIRRR